ncbi:hypothetical protein ACFWA1_20475 [Streptomyces sp. NPDC060005]|uniref:hypothetical protein n=1 Tax=Streptomyces sp. NPDC060005 TaxID=3347034 RepID=UPI0036BB047F
MHISLAGLVPLVKALIPAIGPLAIAFVAAIAIKGNRKTSNDALQQQASIEHRQFYRDNLLDTYLGLTRALERCSDSDYERDLWKGAPKDLEAKLLLFATIVVKATLQAWYIALERRDVEELDRLKYRIIDLMREELGTGPASLSVTHVEVLEARGVKGQAIRLAIKLRLRKPRPASYVRISTAHDK